VTALTVDQVLDLLPDPDLVGESAYRAIHETVADALASLDDEDVAGGGAARLAVAELENFALWARELAEKVRAATAVAG
jgi:hypothetical protein